MTDGRSEVLQVEADVDGDRYSILMIEPERGFEIGIELIKMIGAPIGSMATAGKDGAVSAMPNAIEALMKNIDPKRLRSLSEELFKYVRYNNVELNKTTSQMHFRGRTGHYFKVFAKCIEVQFSDFFDAVTESVKDVIAKAVESKSPSTSAGQ